METAVALILFNRPEMTRQVFSKVARAKPPRLYLIADGPRSNVEGDFERCEETRRIVENITWDCDVKKNYAHGNLGCGRRPATGISWVFKHEERAIILEDDCVPDDTFFPYCDDLLARFADDERIFQVCGQGFQQGHRRGPYSYYFSRHNFCWGWASWRRAWDHFDFEMKLWPELREMNVLGEILSDERAVNYWREIFDRAHAEHEFADYWDYQWTFSCWAQSGLSAIPNASLITNIGFGPEGTHTKWQGSPHANIELEPIALPLKHPEFVAVNREADQFFVDSILGPRSKAKTPLLQRFRQAIRNAV